MKKAIYAGSFDPFTNGHLNILMKSLSIFDEVHIVIAKNSSKNKSFSEEEMKDAIEKTLFDRKIDNVKVVVYDGFIADYARENTIFWSIRGLRNNMDYNYEENIAIINKEIHPLLETLYLRSDNAAISSSFVRELLKYDKDISKYVPKDVLFLIKNK